MMHELPHPYDHGGPPPEGWVQDKLDGVRLIVRRGRGGVTATTRTGKTDLWPALPGPLARALEALPEGTVLDGELWSPEAPASSIMGVAAGRVVPALTYSPFAVPALGGRDARETPLPEAMGLIRSLGFNPPQTAPCGPGDDAGELLARARGRAAEGVVFKTGHYAGWTRLKPTETTDGVIVRVVEGRGRHTGRLGALELAAGGRPLCRVGTGFADHERAELWARRWSLVGLVVEVVHEGHAANGAPRFPRFSRFRPDKPASACGPAEPSLFAEPAPAGAGPALEHSGGWR